MEIGTRDVESPVVMSRRVTPANRPLQHLEAGRLGASGASVKTGRFRCVIHSLSLEAAVVDH